MKHLYIICIVLLLAAVNSLSAQPNLVIPNNWLNEVEYNNNNIIGQKLEFGELIQKKDGVKSTIHKSTDIIWKYHIKVEGAKQVVPFFDHLALTSGSYIKAYSPVNKSHTREFRNNQNRHTSTFALPAINGNEVIIEARFENPEAFELFEIEFSQVGAIFSSRGFGDAPECYANVNCAEGDEWQDQIRSVAKYMSVSGSDIGYCTGSLINNTAEDCKNYFLSAQHCGMTSSLEEFGQFIFTSTMRTLFVQTHQTIMAWTKKLWSDAQK